MCGANRHVCFGPIMDIGLCVSLCPSLLGAGPPACRFIDGEWIHRPVSNVNVKDNLVLAPNAADSMLANVGFAAVQKPTFYRKRAQVAANFAKHCRDETAKQMFQRVAGRWRELATLAGSRKSSRASSKPKNGSLGSEIHQSCFRALNPTSQITTDALSSARRAPTSRLKLSNTDKS
jgi:hypothetical protein